MLGNKANDYANSMFDGSDDSPQLSEWCIAHNGYVQGYKDALKNMESSSRIIESQETIMPEDYDSGIINDHGGGNVGWWQDYIRSEVGRCNQYWREQLPDSL